MISQPPVRTFAIISSGDPVGYVQQSVSAAAGLSSIPSDANKAIIQPETGDIRYRDDGTAPTSSVGMYLFADNTLTIESLAMLNAIQLIAVSGTVTVNISYYKK